MGGPRYEQLFTATGEFRAAGRQMQLHRQRAADPPHRRAQARRILGTLLAVGDLPQRPGVRLHRLPAASRRPAHLQRGLSSSPATGPHGGAGGTGAVAAPTATPGRRRLTCAANRRRPDEIDGETVLSTHDIHHDDDMYSMQALKQEMPSFPALQQAGVRYRWDGEIPTACSNGPIPLDKIARD